VSKIEGGSISRFTRINCPVARDEGLLVEELGDETVVFDSETKEAHCLSPLAAIVFAQCDGETTIEELAVLATDRIGEPVDEARVTDALAQLQERDLLAVSVGGGLSRREMIGKSAAAGGTLVGASLITTVLAPTAAVAQTGIPSGCGGCEKNSDCTSNHCCQNNAGKDCSQGCCVGVNNSCHFCDIPGSEELSCTVTPADIGGPCPTPEECAPFPVCCTETPPC
jgi:Coenzyme PQQ synthesis protein D (PqqD)